MTPALRIGSAIASDSQNVVPALILMPAVGILLALQPAREEFFRRGAGLSRKLLAITILGAIPLIAYALNMGAQAQDLIGPPHHMQRLFTMAAMAIAIVLVGLLAAFKTRGWRIPAWGAGTAAIVFGLASMAFPDDPGAVGRGWGGLVIAGSVLFIAVAESEGRGAAGRHVSEAAADIRERRRFRTGVRSTEASGGRHSERQQAVAYLRPQRPLVDRLSDGRGSGCVWPPACFKRRH